MTGQQPRHQSTSSKPYRQEGEARSTRLYSPEGLYVWDTWYLNLDGEVHVFYLQMKRPGSVRDLPDNASLGHAVSTDLHHWTELPVAILPGREGEYDDGHIFTGCALDHGAKTYLYYTRNHTEDGRRLQGICLATSDDRIHFTKHPENPVIEPSPEVYFSKSTDPAPFRYHNWPAVDCRDLAIVPSPTGDGWLGYAVMRLRDAGMEDSCCIALCRSKDLFHWSVGPPCCRPGRFTCFEVPDVFQLDGRWYMMALTADSYGQRARFSDSNCGCATIVFESDNPLGPFEEVEDNLLLASRDHQGFSARTVEFEGKRLMLYTRPEGGWLSGGSNWGQISWPVELVARAAGGLTPRFWRGNEGAFARRIPLEPCNARARKGWSLQPIPTPDGQPRKFMFQCRIDFDATAVGVSFHRTDDQTFSKGRLVLWDRERHELELCTLPDFRTSQCRRCGPRDSRLGLRLVVVGDMVEAYLDDELVLNEFRPCSPGRSLQAFCENGKADFHDMVLYRD